MIKTIAEWNEQEYLILSLPHENTDWRPYLEEILISYEDFVKAVSEFQKVLLIGPDEYIFNQRFKKFKNVYFFQCETNDTWIRDYGAIDIYKDDKLLSLNFHFNAWGNKFDSKLDNALNKKLFDYFNNTLIDIDLILEGGSIDFNGDGVMLTTTKCLLNKNRNNISKIILENKLKKIFNLNQIIWLENGFIQGDDTDSHIDILARFIDKNTIAHCVCWDENDEHFIELEKMKKELEKTGFKLIELPLPKPIFYEGKRLGASYLNFVFINNALIVPSYNDENDDIVCDILAKALNNKKIIKVDARVFIRQNGSLHCACQNRFKGQRI